MSVETRAACEVMVVSTASHIDTGLGRNLLDMIPIYCENRVTPNARSAVFVAGGGVMVELAWKSLWSLSPQLELPQTRASNVACG